MRRIKICKAEGCHNAQTSAGYCRYHYLRNWKDIKQEQSDKAARRLNKYIDAVCKKHPKRYIEVIKEDINSQKYQEQGPYREEMDELYRLFNESSYDDDIENLIKDLKIEKDF